MAWMRKLYGETAVFQFGDAIQLTMATSQLRDQAIFITTTWQAQQQPTADHTLFIHLYRQGEEDRQPVAQLDNQPCYATSQWQPAIARLGQIQVEPGQWQVEADNAAIDTFSPTATGVPGLVLQGWPIPEIIWRSGETASLELLWSADDIDSPEPVRADIYLTNENGMEAMRHTITVGDAYPSTEWRTHELVRDSVMWRLPAALNSGHYSVWMNVASEPKHRRPARCPSTTLPLCATIPPMKSKLLTLLALALLVIPAASPYFLSGIPRTNDLTPHLMRTLFWGEAATYSGLWPRWSAELVYGYGYPVFNFFPSLFHAAVQVLYQIGLPLLTAYRVMVYLHFLLAALGSYLLGKEVFHSRLAGWGAAVVYVYSPYLLYDAIVRGSAPETQALALLPLLILALWKASEQLSVNREQGTGDRGQLSLFTVQWQTIRQSLICNLQSPKWVVLTAVLFALTFLSHPIAYQLLIPIGVWLLIKAGFAQRHFDRLSGHGFWHTLIGPALGIALGGFLVAFFWLPAFAEVGLTRADSSISQGYSYQTNFLSLLDMLSFPAMPADPALINPPVVRAVPAVGLLWALIVLAWGWRRTNRWQHETIAAWTAVLILSIWLITPTSKLVWDYFPLLRLTFYPWRLLSMTSVATAVLVALSMRLLGDSPKSLIANLLPSFLLTILILITSIPWLYPPRQTMPETISLARALQEESPPYFIGTTTLGEFLPQTVIKLPDSLPENDPLRAGENPDRLQALDGLTWTRLNDNPIAARYEMVAQRPLTAVYRQFNFPGWQAKVDGQPVPITASDPYGLITFPVPAGNHEVQISFTNTGARWLGWIMSALALAALLVLARQTARHPQPAPTSAQSSTVKPQSLILLGTTAVLIWLLFSFIETPLRRSTLLADGIWGKPAITPLDFAGEVRLLSYEAPTQAIAADDTIQLNLYFQAQTEIGVPYNIGVQVVDSNGLNWMADSSRPFNWRFIADEPWPLNAYRLEPSLITLLDGTPPGTYHFHVGLVRADTGQTVAAYDVGDLFIGQPGTGKKALEAGLVASSVAPAGSVTDEVTAVSENLSLLGTRLDRAKATPGDPVRVTGLWQVLAPTAQNQFTLQLVSAAGEVLVSKDVTIAPLYPPEQWQAGDRLRSETVLRLPAATPDGNYTWQILWGDQLVPAGTVQVRAPERSFERIEMETAVGATFAETFGNVATLLGVNAHAETDEVTLIWQAENETATSYRVFVHLLGADGEIISQSDGEPVSWSRPTTSWLPGEILQDSHRLTFPLDAPAGSLSLRIGLYDAETGQRLSTDSGDSLLIALP